MDIIELVLLSVGLGLGIGSAILGIKTEVTYHCHLKIMRAIHRYVEFKILVQQECIDGCALLDDMEDFDDTFYRLWDWGCKRIVSPETYEKIKPYLD